ncbi:PLDc N-terminal domain-containing protein [Nanoarchaeota archaeon]
MDYLIFPLIILLYLGVFAIIVLPVAFFILMLIDCIKRDFKNDNDKVVWILMIVFFGVIAAVIYYFAVKRKDKKKKKKAKKKKK